MFPRRLPIKRPHDRSTSPPVSKRQPVSFDDDFTSDDDEDVLRCSSHDAGLTRKGSTVKVNRHLETFHEDIGLSEQEVEELKSARCGGGGWPGEEGKKGTVLLERRGTVRQSHPPPEIIVFVDPAKRAKAAGGSRGRGGAKGWGGVRREGGAGQEGGARGDVDAAGSCDEIELKKARQEVLRFGIKGLQSTDKDAAVLDMLVKLGAKAPKSSYISYKELMSKRKEEKEKTIRMKSSHSFLDQGKLAASRSLNDYKRSLSKTKKVKGGERGGEGGGGQGGNGVVKIKKGDVRKFAGNHPREERGGGGKGGQGRGGGGRGNRGSFSRGRGGRGGFSRGRGKP